MNVTGFLALVGGFLVMAAALDEARLGVPRGFVVFLAGFALAVCGAVMI